MRRLKNIYRLGLKELIAARYDKALMLLVVYGLTVMVYVPAANGLMELRNASVAIVDEDRSPMSRRIGDAIGPPLFHTPRFIALDAMDKGLDGGLYTFVLDIPPNFQKDALRGRQPMVQLAIDATAMSHAGIGAGFIEQIVQDEVAAFLSGHSPELPEAAKLVVRAKFNPNLYDSWYLGVMMVLNVINMLSVVTTGAALIRERERGTLDHLLVMPLSAFEIMAAKLWANAAVVTTAVLASLLLVVRGVLGVPLQGSMALFMAATVLYLFSANSIGIFLATLARSMPQMGLLAILVIFPMSTLSGNTTPFESMPETVQKFMRFSPSTHYVSIAQAVLYRGAGFESVWRELAAVAGIGALFFLGALMRFRHAVALSQA